MKSPAEIEDIIQACFGPLIASQSSAVSGKVPGILVGTTCKGSHQAYLLGTVPLFMPGAANPSPENIGFFIGSNTKVFTATLLAMAAGQTPPVAQLATEITTMLPTSVKCTQWTNQPVQLWHLATHSAGYPDGPCGESVWGDYTFEETGKFLNLFLPDYAPGQYWVYSDQGFALLGILLAHAYTGTATQPADWDPSCKNWPVLISDQILWGLGLSKTQVGCSLAQVPYLAQNFAFVAAGSAYSELTVPQVNLESAALGAGALTSTLADMLTFLDNQIAPPSGAIGTAITLTQTVPPGGSGLSMGLGWQIGTNYFDKNGLVENYASWMGFDPTSGWGLFAMANSESDDKGGTLMTAARTALGKLRCSEAPPPTFPMPPPELAPVCPGDKP